ncbi:oxidoreductase [Vibrio sp. 10N.286.49.C2]|uniref:Gfo/Idh/MocA family protein n=1 Tax=unclassified Vibrio TaxID=2614977 RepID=UPI000C840174|nr:MULTISPECIES: Gfo/Idh/MocA family oxidoreductase [unclassified Vibrio]PMH26440.1 oxidoreductase [Vibrio sp. 10N.286.49.C2]PMH54836.1 oxidoreductase [Vibrio sp. 10N.286.49.B1]PMH82092.1 oxidoreductase [Vibrio sp. 10N.286.48.B7]
MLNLATIGSNWITECFVEAALASGVYQLVGVYSRDIEKAQLLADKYLAPHAYDNLNHLARDERIDAVYIASPNSLHFEQSKMMLESGKHVICEKPLASNVQEVRELYRLAEENNVVLFEAFKTEYLPNFAVVRNALGRVGPMKHAFFNYCQYSSRYQRYLDGEQPNTFNPAFSNGSIMDIGYYCIAAMVSLFGRPRHVSARAVLLDSGVDGAGHVSLDYGDFIATVQHSKTSNSKLPSEIQGEAGSLILENFPEGKTVTLALNDGSSQDLTLDQHENTMVYEALHFHQQVTEGNADKSAIERSIITAEVLTEVRRQTGVRFPADGI